MKNRFYVLPAACLVLLLGISPSVPAKSADAGRPGFTEADAEYYLSDQQFFFFRPGVDFELISFEIPADLQPLVTFRVTDPSGNPLHLRYQIGRTYYDVDDGVTTPGAVDIRFMLSYIPAGQEQKVNYHPETSGRDQGDGYTYLGDGAYTYKFATVLPADYEADATHTLISSAQRDFRPDFAEYPELTYLGIEDRYYDSDLYNFVPSGAAEPNPRDIVATETCNRCHLDSLNMAHGTRYQHVQACQNCHNPTYLGEEYTFNALVHRIHSSNEEGVGEIIYPADLNDCEVCHTGGTPTQEMPLVANPNPITTCDGSGLGMTTIEWGDAGAVDIRLNSTSGKLFARASGAGSAETGNWVRDGMKFVLADTASGEILDSEIANLTVFGCAGNAPYSAYGRAGDWHSNWMTRPARLVCGGCHAEIDWETGENHAGSRQDTDEFCSFCHRADSGKEFDASVKGAHTVVENSAQLNGVYVQVKAVTNTAPGQSPTVTFSVMGKNGPIDPNTMNRMRFKLSGPNEDFDFNASEDAPGKAIANGNDWTYTFTTKLPSDAEGSYSLSFEARADGTVNGEAVRDTAENYLFAFAVTDASAEARRTVVDDAKCEACHSNLALHGGNRHNGGQYCQVCHMPGALGETEREGAPEGQEDSIHFKFMVHKIHMGEDLEYGYAVGGHVYDHVVFPGDVRACETCHVEDSYVLPLDEGLLPTETPLSFLTEMEPVTAACLSCHDSLTAAQHADANTGDLGESCNTCHAEGKAYAVSRVHAR